MSTRVDDLDAVILRRREWRNTSLILDVFTREQGNLSLLARGARKSRSRSDYEPFVLLSLGYSGQQELKVLTGIEGRPVGVDVRNYSMLLYLNELMLNLMPKQEPGPEIYDAYVALLEHARNPLDERDLREFEILLLSSLGYFPDIGIDADNGAAIDADGVYQYRLGSGFVACNPEDSDAVGGTVVLGWLRGDYDDARVCRLARSVMRATVDFNLHGKTLKSREVYSQMSRRR